MALLFPSRSRTLRHLVVDAVGVTVVAGGAAMALLPQGLDVTDTGDAAAPAIQAQRAPIGAREQALMERFHCRIDGFGKQQVPRSSIIRRADGRLAVVGFDRGWQVLKGDGAGSLVAVCLAPPR